MVHLHLPPPLRTSRCPSATCHHHSLPKVLAHPGRHRGEHASPHCGEPDQDCGCVSGRIFGLLKTKHYLVVVKSLYWTTNVNWTHVHKQVLYRVTYSTLLKTLNEWSHWFPLKIEEKTPSK